MPGSSKLTRALGASALSFGVGAGIYGSFHQRDDEDAGFFDKLRRGALYGTAGGAVLAAGTLHHGAIASGAWSWSSRRPGMYSAFKSQSGKGFKSGLSAFSRAYMPLPVAAGVGAAIGAYMSPDDRGRGAMIGAGVGSAAALALRIPSGYSSMSRMGKFGMIGAITMAAGMIGSKLGAGASDSDTAAGVINDSGEQEIVSPQEAAERSSGLKHRLRSMNASGGVVLGSHNRRHN